MEAKTVGPLHGGRCGQGTLKVLFGFVVALVVMLAILQMYSGRLQCSQPVLMPTSISHHTDIAGSGVSNFSDVSQGSVLTTSVALPTTSKADDSLLPTQSPVRISCQKLIARDPLELVKADSFMASHPRYVVLPNLQPKLMSNCSSYIADTGYILSNVTDVEKEFPIAFSLVIFKHVSQVERLLRAIYRPQNVYCIHIDSKSDPLFRQTMEGIVKCLDNVFLTPRSVDVRWGQFSVLEPELICLDALWKHKVKWRYFINLTGQEYPLKTNYELVRILKTYNGACDVHATFKGLNRDRVQGRLPAPHNIQPAKGSLHVAVSRAFVDFALHDQRALEFTEWLKTVGVPDEMYFNSFYANRQLKVPGSFMGDVDSEPELKDHMARYKIWYDQSRCGGKFAHAICIFGVRDLAKLTTVPHFFANKFHYDYQPLAYDCLEQWYMNKVAAEQQGKLHFDTSFYAERNVVKQSYRPSV